MLKQKLKQELQKRGVTFLFFKKDWQVEAGLKTIIFNDNARLTYDHLINCAGLQADKVAQKFNVGNLYTMLPFKGSYWQFKKDWFLPIMEDVVIAFFIYLRAS